MLDDKDVSIPHYDWMQNEWLCECGIALIEDQEMCPCGKMQDWEKAEGK